MRPLLAAALLFAVLAGALAERAYALDTVVVRKDNVQTRITGRVVLTAENGGILVQSVDGSLWTVEPEELVSRTTDDRPFTPLTSAELVRQLTKEMGPGFSAYTTKHYLIMYNTSRAYAAWCGSLFERLHTGYFNYWARTGLKLHESEFPLVALVFADQQSYMKYSAPDLGKNREVPAYYNLRTNRIALYDLTGVEALRRPGDRRGSVQQINQMLNVPEAEYLVSNVVHEATHQLCFNSGMQARYADIPLWLCEGLAVYFETPDLGGSSVWRTIGAVNHSRLDQFRKYLPQRPANSLKTLLTEDRRFREPRLAPDLYAEAWALNHYLLKQHPKEFAAYLELLSKKEPLMSDTSATRLQDFRQAFHTDPSQLEAEFLRYVQKLR